MAKDNKGNGFIKGSIIGMIIGGIAALLLAPKSGRETQADIKRTVKGAADDLYARLETLNEEVTGRVDHLKEAAKDLHGEAKQESQELVRRAEVLKQDMRIAGTNLAKNSGQTKETAVKNVKTLLAEGADVMKELERVTRQLAGSAKDKVTTDPKSKAPHDDAPKSVRNVEDAVKRQEKISDELEEDEK